MDYYMASSSSSSQQHMDEQEKLKTYEDKTERYRGTGHRGHPSGWKSIDRTVTVWQHRGVQAATAERENVQKRTFTRWINLHLEKRNPPMEVKDLFVDIQDGRILMALLEVLTGQNLLHEYKSSTHRIFRLNNIAKALKFLEDSNVKLVSIDAAEIADGNPSLVLGLIWNIILFLQIKELTGNLNRMSSSSSLSSLPSGTESDTSHPGTLSTEKSLSVSIKDQRRAIKALLSWVQQRTRKYGVAVQDFAGSWRSGLAFLAVIKAIDSSLVDIKKALERSARENLEDAFTIAQRSLNIPRLLEPEDVMVDSPDEQSIMTYVTQFLEHFPELDPDDFTDRSEDAPVEMTYVHYKDGPREEEGKIITIPKNEENDFTVELQTRPLTPPETHVYTEVNVADDRNPSPMNSFSKPQWLSSKATRGSGPETAGFMFDRFLRRPEMSSLNSGVSGEVSGNGFKKIKNTEGPVEPVLLSNGPGELHYNLFDEDSPKPTSGGPKDQEPNYILSDDYNKYCDSSSSFSSISDREPNDLFYHSEDFQGSIKPSPMSDDSGLVTPHDQNEEDDIFKYISHLPKDHLEGEPSKQRTVFQAYKSSTDDKVNSKNRLDSIEDHLAEETNSVEDKNSAKVSIIPHDLFYYPHYSVPIADVLQAFADTCPDGINRSDREFDDSSENHSEGSDSFSGDDDLDGEMIEKVTSVPESEEWGLGLKDFVQDVTCIKTGSPAWSVGSILNGSVSQPAHDLQPNNSSFHSGYNDNSQVTEHTEDPDDDVDESITSGERVVSRKSNLEFHLIEDHPCKLAAEVEASPKDPWLSRAIQNDAHTHNRKEHEFNKVINVRTLREENTEGDKDQNSGPSKSERGDTRRGSPSSGPLTPAKDLRKMYYIGILLWFICYCAFILPELDMSKVEFLVRDD
ncbi:PREDICTED: calmin [Nanorana parkeri]|uniref:calmin n=1 Tax=Nanorana parkeri TaxID=125878 RepID=UPI000854FA71|nr:PREDICTED: calmin [Nanorana parkeri]